MYSLIERTLHDQGNILYALPVQWAVHELFCSGFREIGRFEFPQETFQSSGLSLGVLPFYRYEALPQRNITKINGKTVPVAVAQFSLVIAVSQTITGESARRVTLAYFSNPDNGELRVDEEGMTHALRLFNATRQVPLHPRLAGTLGGEKHSLEVRACGEIFSTKVLKNMEGYSGAIYRRDQVMLAKYAPKYVARMKRTTA